MTAPDRPAATVYSYPHYYAIGYQWNTTGECDFLEACLATYRLGSSPRAAEKSKPKTPASSATVFDIGCGAGRHLLELAKRGYRATGFDLRPEMVAFVQERATKERLPIEAFVGDLRQF